MMEFDPGKALAWLSDTWLVWLIYALVALAGWALYWYLREQRCYRMLDGRLQARHGRLGKWVDAERHMSESHSEGE